MVIDTGLRLLSSLLRCMSEQLLQREHGTSRDGSEWIIGIDSRNSPSSLVRKRSRPGGRCSARQQWARAWTWGSELEPASSGFFPICPFPMITEVLAGSVRGSHGESAVPGWRVRATLLGGLGCDQQEAWPKWAFTKEKIASQAVKSG